MRNNTKEMLILWGFQIEYQIKFLIIKALELLETLNFHILMTRSHVAMATQAIGHGQQTLLNNIFLITYL